MPEPNEKRYNETVFQIVATHPTTGEQVAVLTTKYENQLSAVSGALARLGISFSQSPLQPSSK